MQAIFRSHLVETWTAFETLAGDLWVRAVNAQPKYLAGLTGAQNRIEKVGSRSKAKTEEASPPVEGSDEGRPTGEPETTEPRGGKSITLGLMSVVSRGVYDFSNRMGTLLVEAERVKFTSLKSIREAYSMAFPEKAPGARSKRIDTALADKNLDALSAVRNLIVHKAGIADAVYLEDWKGAQAAPRLAEWAELELDGQVCRTLMDPVIKASVELVKAVDSWLTGASR
jgi:hypothetical protein